MTEPEHISEELRSLMDGYLNETLDEAGIRALEDRLRSDAGVREYFVLYCGLHADLFAETRLRKVGRGVLSLIEQAPGAEAPAASKEPADASRARRRFRRRLAVAAAAAAILASVAFGAWSYRRAREDIAWLVNAQDCQWASDFGPTSELHRGKRLRIVSGLAELRFRSGATVVLQGPADLELLSKNSAQLYRGRLTARVPEPAKGFTIFSPQGEVIDLGTEFGVSVAEDGSTDVLVFEGEVIAQSKTPSQASVNLQKDQAIELAEKTALLEPELVRAKAREFVRAILPPPRVVPRTLALDFSKALPSPICDAAGQGTGLTHRLPGTGAALPEDDPNLVLDATQGRLTVHSTWNDLNRQRNLEDGEYLGVRLSDLGFTGDEDFAVSLTVPGLPQLQAGIGQLGLYAGTRSDKHIRGGVLTRNPPDFSQFLVHNNGGTDSDLYRVGIANPGEEVQFTLRRTAGKYTLTIENRTTSETSTLAIRPAEFLADEGDLYVGMFVANGSRQPNRNLVAKEFQVTVWTRSP